MSLPNETLLAILGSLEKRDLKSVRLVSKSWSSIASIYLFEKLYVSANQEDLDVFEAVAKHPSLRQHVRTLSYDGTFFYSDMARIEYTRHVLMSKPSEGFFTANDSTYVYPHRDIEEWIRNTPRTPISDHKWKDFRYCDFINDGLRKYRDHADAQKELLASGKFVEILVDGLKRLNSLHSITVRSRWEQPRNPDECHTGSPLARSWDIFHLTPEGWNWAPTDDHSYMHDGARHYEIITSALVEAEKHVQSFDMNGCEPPGISAQVFEGEDETSIKCPRADALAFAQLRSLSLVVAASEGIRWPMDSGDQNSVYDFLPGIYGLPMLLSSMSSLTRLRLQMPSDFGEPSVFYKYHHVFSKGTQWDKLESITLQHLAITANQFMELVTKRMPNLRRLTLANLNLLEGTWECVFQAFSEMKPPPILDFIHGKNDCMLHCEGDTLWQPGYPSSFFKDLASYVTNGGGRHPCLPDGLPDSAAVHLFCLDTT